MEPKLHWIKRIVYVLLIAGATFSLVKIVQVSAHNQQLKTDLAEVNHIRYGMLNVEEWKKILSDILAKKIREFDLTPQNRKDLKVRIERVMARLLDEVDAIVRENNSQQGFFGAFKQLFTDIFFDLDQFRARIPEFADLVLDELEKPETREKIREYLQERLDQFFEETFTKDEQLKLKAVLKQYECTDRIACQTTIAEQIQNSAKQRDMFIMVFLGMLGLGILIAMLPGWKTDKIGISFLLVLSLLCLFAGISTPMIEIDARIASLSFQLIGEEVLFTDQVLFFQSKSILDVFWLLIQQGDWKLIGVACLVFMFSVIFPLAKLLSSVFYTFEVRGLHRNRIVQFFALRSGKWSMADVIVVAIFMAYIGFNGMLSAQLDQLGKTSERVELLSTNDTVLLSGFYLFFLFTLGSLFLSGLRKKMSANSAEV